MSDPTKTATLPEELRPSPPQPAHDASVVGLTVNAYGYITLSSVKFDTKWGVWLPPSTHVVSHFSALKHPHSGNTPMVEIRRTDEGLTLGLISYLRHNPTNLKTENVVTSLNGRGYLPIVKLF